jgi:hypothetical protein
LQTIRLSRDGWPATMAEQDNTLSKRRKSRLHISLDNRLPKGQQEHGMTTAEEYRHIAEEFFRLAHEAKTEDASRLSSEKVGKAQIFTSAR